jgi:hypothetical protein
MLRKLRGVVLGMFVGIALMASTPSVRATDIPIFPTGPVYRLTNLVWGTSTQPGFNNNYFFTPLSQNESVCVYVRNNNTTNAHTFTASIVINSDPANISPSDATWQAAASSSGISVPASPGANASIAAQISGVAQVSINLSASTVQAGSPDTANISIIQTQGTCFSGNLAISSAPTTFSATVPIQTISDGLSQSFYSSFTVTNPAINTVVNLVNGGFGGSVPNKTLYFDRLLVSVSAAATITVNPVITSGTGCAQSITTANFKIQSVTTSTAGNSSGQACAVVPTASNAFLSGLTVPANTLTSIDLRGFIVPSGTAFGIDVVMPVALTGTITTSIIWYEK